MPSRCQLSGYGGADARARSRDQGGAVGAGRRDAVPIRAGYRAAWMYDPGEILRRGILSRRAPSARSTEGVLDAVEADPASALATASRIVRKHEIVFGKGDAKQDFVLDPIPRIVAGAEWAELERGLAQRARALNALLADIYGERRIVAEGVIPERVVNGAEYLEPEMEGLVGPSAATVIGFDLVRGHGWAVPRPRGQHPNPVRHGVRRSPPGRERGALRPALTACAPLDPVFEWLARRCAEAAPDGVEDPVDRALSDGPDNSAWYEHVQVAERSASRSSSPATWRPGRRARLSRPDGDLAQGRRGPPADRCRSRSPSRARGSRGWGRSSTAL